MTNDNDCPQKTNDDAPTAADLALADALLADLDLTSPDAFDQSNGLGLSAKLSAADKWQEKRRQAWREKRNKEERDLYAAIKRAEGRGEVRAYHWHDHEPRQWNETEGTRAIRMKRDRQRTYRGTTNVDVEAREITRQFMTPEEKTEAKRQRERNRRAAMTPDQKRADAQRKKDRRAEAKDREKAEAEASIEARRIF